MKKRLKKISLKEEVENLLSFGDIDVTPFPSPEQLSIAQELEIIDNIERLYYYIDGKTVIVELSEGYFAAFRKNPKAKSCLGLRESLIKNGDSFLLKQVLKNDNRNYK
jgi:hypothetical protein